MPQVTFLWSAWQRLLQPFAWIFTRPGYRRFVEWITALALNVEEHTITPSLSAIERLADWEALERFAEYGAWDPAAVTRSLTQLVEQAPGRLWHGYHADAYAIGKAPSMQDRKIYMDVRPEVVEAVTVPGEGINRGLRRRP